MSTPTHDVVIIGSGASGGMVAWSLCQRGIKCLMLDAGPALDFKRDRIPKKVYELPYRGFGRPGRFPHVTQADEFNANLWLDEKQNPYTTDPKDPFYWVRVRLVGGKTLIWGRACWRLSDQEFAGHDRDGFGDNWPIRYKDLAPYYDKVEPLFKVAGRNEGFEQIPDGNLLPDTSHDSAAVARFIAACKTKNVPVTKQRRSTGALASSVNLLLPDALKTGNLTIVPNAVVREITTDRNTGLVNGVSFLDRHSSRELRAKARVVVVGASCLESTRLLLNSGIANSSGVLGRYLFDQIYVKNVVQAIVPDAKAPFGGSGYIPKFRNVGKRTEKNFLRGYAYDFGSGGTPNPKYFPLYGEALQRKLAQVTNQGFSMTTMGEVLARPENRVTIDKDCKDAWGIPSLRFDCRYSDNEREMATDSMNTAEELCHEAGFQVIGKHAHFVPFGESIHDLGTCRMGADPKTSVLNGWNQSHDIKNLYVVDGSSFVSGGAQNPTLTILALALRASDHLAEQRW